MFASELKELLQIDWKLSESMFVEPMHWCHKTATSQDIHWVSEHDYYII